MKKILILEQEDLEKIYYSYDRYTNEVALNTEPLKSSDIIFLEHSKNYYFIWKSCYSTNIVVHNPCINKKDIADYVAGKVVKLYNIENIVGELYNQISNNIVSIPEHINFLYRMELND